MKLSIFKIAIIKINNYFNTKIIDLMLNKKL